MATYDNDLRLKEIATGDESGTWGASTNTNLELIAEAFSFGTEQITTNADTFTTTIADGSSDPGRSIFLKYTGTLDSACTVTIGPNDVSKLWLIENATTGSQNIIISQGSGADVTIPAGDTKAIYSDGAGSGAAMVDAFASLNVVDLKVQDDLTVTDDVAIGGLATVGGTLGVTGVVTANAGVVVDNITIDGTEIDLSSGDLTIDVAGDINLDADGGEVFFKDGGTSTGKIRMDDGDLQIRSLISDKDITLEGNDGGSIFEAMRLDMSAAGAATFSGNVGIGAAPLDMLHLKGTDPSIRFEDTSGDAFAKIEADSADEGSIRIQADPGNSGANSIIRFDTDGSERARIDPAGSVGINVAPSGSWSGNSVLQMSHGSFTSSSSFGAGVSTNLVGTAAGWTANYLATGAASLYLQATSDGSHRFYTIASGSAGADASSAIIERFRIALDGDVGIGESDNSNYLAPDLVVVAKAQNGGITVKSSSTSHAGTLAFADATSGLATYDGYIQYEHNNRALTFASAGGERLRLTGNEAIFNDGSGDYDFRVESNDNANMLFVDGGNNRVGIAKVPASNQFEVGVFAQFDSGASLGGALTGTTASFSQSSTSDPVLSLTDAGVIEYKFVFPDTGTIQLECHASSDKTLKLDNTAAGTFSLDVEGSSTLRGNVICSDLKAAGSGGLSFQTDEGTKRVIIDDSTGQVQVSPGSASVPGLSFIGDTNTGINADNADNLGFTVGGTQRAFLSSTQFNVNANGVFAGSISKASGSFKIDHPLPAKTDTHHLVHSFVEAPQADNIYRGSVDLVGGSATVNIDTVAGMTDGTFVLLNTNVQCFTSNESGWTAIKGSVSGNTLTITAQDSDCTDTISWMVVGERHDQHMKDAEWTDSDGKVIVEPEKVSEGE